MVQQVEECVLGEIEARRGEMVSFLQALVQQPSTLGKELGAQCIVYRKLKSLGLSAEMWEPRLDMLASHPAFAPVEWSYEGRPNVTAIHPASGKGGKSLVLNGHIDVVSPEPVWGWTYDPWGGQIVGTRLYGRGAADMKGGIAMMVLALEGIIAASVSLHGDVFFETVLEEECTGNGALACRIKGYSAAADAAIITEPFALGANVADLGVMWFRVRLRGKSGHVASAHKSHNVIEMCFPLIRALRELEQEMNQYVSHPAYAEHEHPINLNVGTIEGGHWPSSVPAECSFVCRLSYEPGLANQEIRRQVEKRIMLAAQQHPGFEKSQPVIEYFGLQGEGSMIGEDTELLRTLARAHHRLLGEELRTSAQTGLTDMRYFNLYASTPAVGFGPKGDNIHNADEYVELDTIVTGAQILALFMLDWCGCDKR